jgi:phosphoribosylanthranilate isomerase
MPLTIKICGLSTADTVEAALAAGADMIGFVFAAKSPRCIGHDVARALARQVRAPARKVALVVDADDEAIDRIVAALAPDLLQLHGTETPERVEQITARFGLPVMKAIGVSARGDLDAATLHRGRARHLLIDAKPPKDAAYPGGHGRPFDWSILDEEHPALDPGRRFMLSGGLNAGNVAQAIRRTRPWGIDASSGLESAPGVKDVAKITAFVAAARAVERSDAEHAGQRERRGEMTW